MSTLPPVRGRFRGQKVALLVGGLSSEREVSLATGAAFAGALGARGYDVEVIDAGRDVAARITASDAAVVFIGLHGTLAEDGRLQGLLDWLGKPYTGSGARASLLAFDKSLARRVFAAAALPLAERLDPAGALEPPVVVKPAAEGSSVGVTIVRAAEDLAAALRLAGQGGGEILVERFVEGPEISVAVLDGVALGTVEIEPVRGFYDYEAKYADDAGTRYHVPPRLPAEQIAAAERYAEAAHVALGCAGVTRVDFIASAGGPILLEVNTLPGMTSHSLVPMVAAHRGIEFPELCERILDLAIGGADGA